jgi:O-antigen ligase
LRSVENTEAQIRTSCALVCAAMVGVSLAVLPVFSFSFDVAPKVVILGLITAALLLHPRQIQLCIQRVSDRAEGRELLLLLSLGSVSLVLSTLLSGDPVLAAFGTRWRAFGAINQLAALACCLVATGCFMARSNHLRSVLRSISIAAGISSLYAIAQFAGFDPLFDASLYTVAWPPVRRPPSTFGHPGYMGAFACVGVFVALALVGLETSRRWRWLHAVTGLLCFSAVLCSGTRAALLGLAAGLAAAAVAAGRRMIASRRWLWLAAGIAVIAASFALSPYGNRLVLRWISDSRGGVRLQLWPDTLALIQRHWMAGSGPDTFGATFPPYESLSLARNYPEFQLESAHNILLDAASGQGLPGVLFLVGAAILAWIWARRTPREHRDTAALLLGGIVASLVFHQFFSFVLPNYLLFLVLLGGLASLAAQRKEPAKLTPSDARWPKSLSISVAWVLAAVGLVLAASAIQVSITDGWFAKIHAFLMEGDVDGAVRAYDSAQRWRWMGDAPLLWYSQQMTGASEQLPGGRLKIVSSRQALSAAESASKLGNEEQVFALYQRAMLLVRSGHFQQAEAFAMQAAARDPMWYGPHFLLSQLLTRAGHYPEALIEAHAAHEILSTANSPARGEVESLLGALQQRLEPTPGP